MRRAYWSRLNPHPDPLSSSPHPVYWYLTRDESRRLTRQIQYGSYFFLEKKIPSSSHRAAIVWNASFGRECKNNLNSSMGYH
jgi:hypothetical protein